MGTTLKSTINVNISLVALSVQQKGFGRGHILGSSNRFAGGVLFKIYTSAAAMLTDSFQTTDPEYIAVLAYFSQQISPPDVMVGYAPSDVAQVETVTPTAIDNTLYTVTINGIASSFTSGVGTTATLIVTGLADAINAQSPALPVVVTGSTTLILTALNAGTGFTISIGAHLALVQTTPDQGLDTALNAIVSAGGTAWYGLCITSRGLADILVVAAWIEGQTPNYIFIACSQDSDVLTAAAGNVLVQLQTAAYANTAYLWSDHQAQYPEAAWFGYLLATAPGSTNWAWKTLAGITATAASVMTATAAANVASQGGNFYMNVGGVNVTQNGQMVNGQWLDVIVGKDWLISIMEQDLFTLLLSVPKLGFDDDGIGKIGNVMNGDLQQAVAAGVVLPNFTIGTPPGPGLPAMLPAASSFSSTVKQSRILPAIPFTAELVGAINGMTINGTLVP